MHSEDGISWEDSLSPKDKEELTYSMLMALLEHQFCAPVNWIETQDSLLQSMRNGSLLEIGPSKILTPMFEKTSKLLKGSGHEFDLPNCSFYSPDEVKEQEKQPNERFAPTERANTKLPIAKPTARRSAQKPVDLPKPKTIEPPKPETIQPPPPPPAATSIVPVPTIQNKPVKAPEIVTCVVASGLRVSQREVSSSQSIKQLSKGRSVVQNEVLGDIAALFGQIPDMAEGLPLTELSRELSKSFSGKLTAAMSTWLNKRISRKLPPSLNAAKLREWLGTKFGWGEDLQGTFLLQADLEGIKGQIRDEKAAWGQIEIWAEAFAREQGLETVAFSEPSAVPAAEPPVSSALPSARQSAVLQAVSPMPSPEEEGEDVDHLHQELGEEFIQGVKGIFNANKVFKYESAWNWLLQDLYQTFHELRDGKKVDESDIQRLCDRADPRMRHCAQNLLRRYTNSLPERCKAFLERLCSLPEEVRSDSKDSSDDDVSYLVDEVSRDGQESSSSSRWSSAPESNSSDTQEPGTEPSSLWSVINTPPSSDSGSVKKGILDVSSMINNIHEDRPGPIKGSTVLIIGGGKRSIGSALAAHLLASGCRVMVTTSSLDIEKRKFYSDMYKRHSQETSKLVLLPFNQGSKQDIDDLLAYVSGTLQWEIDHVFPFAAISESGRTTEGIDSTSEIAHRIMLTNTVRLIGAIATSKRDRGVINHSTQVILPLSPNHGQFGGDGLYAESKLGLEAVLNKWFTEPWSEYVSVCGASIGWTRETGLMAALDGIAEEMELEGIRTYSVEEMALSLGRLMSADIVERCCLQPVFCDLSGGLADVQGLKEKLDGARERLAARVTRERREVQPDAVSITSVRARADIQPGFPDLECWESCQTNNLQGLVDLESIVVIVGMAELGPCGSARTRWELESQGKLSLEGSVELAWMTGLIRWERSRSAQAGCGWVVAESGEPIDDHEIPKRFGEELKQRCGIRPVRANEDEGERLQQVVLEGDMPAFECPLQAAQAFKETHGDRCVVNVVSGETALVTLLRGATLYVPKADKMSHVAGQIPDGWDATRYGIPSEIVAQVDRLSLFGLVCTADAMLSAGILDPYELYQHMHVSELGNCLGSGMGGTSSMEAVNHLEALGSNERSDALAEMFVNTPAAWVNMLLLSASGPIRTPAGACATGLESLDTGVDLINTGKAKFCLVGGQDTYSSPTAQGFARMNATVDAEKELRCGREPHEMSRPSTTTRSGFVQSEGCGVQLLTSASLALEMGLPIYGVIAMTHMAADKLGRSVPAPGQGVLTAARQNTNAESLLLTNPALRRKRIELSLRHLDEKERIETEVAALQETSASTSSDMTDIKAQIRAVVDAERKAVLQRYGNQAWRYSPSISPISASLAAYGLSIDDLTFASMHGTSTKANDINECSTISQQIRHLGRDPHHPVFTSFQKWLTGHGLGAAGSWMLNGALQSLQTGIVPGNTNADDIDSKLRDFEEFVFTSEALRLSKEEMKACSVTSFGFGQKGAQAIVLLPRYVFAAVGKEKFEVYRKKCERRKERARQAFVERMCTGKMVQVKMEAPYKGDDGAFLLDPSARMTE